MTDAASSIDNRQGHALEAALIAAFIYFTFAALTIDLTSDGRTLATLWPADAAVLSVLLLHERRGWPLIIIAGWIANLAANTIMRGWAPGLVLFGAVNMAQTALAAYLLTRKGRIDNLLRDLPTVARFVIFAGFVAPALGAISGSLVSHALYGEPVGPSIVRWYFSNALGLLIVTPCLKALLDGSYRRYYESMSAAQMIEAFVLLAAHAVTVYVVFAQTHLPLLFLPNTTLLLLAFRTGRLGIMLGIVILLVIGAAETLVGSGPINLIHATNDVHNFYLQVYVAVTLATALPVAALVSSRAEAQQLLAEREEALELLLSNSPDVILGFDGAGMCRWAEGPVEAYMGVPTQALLGRGRDVMCLLAPPTLTPLFEQAKPARKRPQTVEFSPLLRSHLTLEASFGVISTQSEISGSVVILRDVTERKARERVSVAELRTDDLTGLLIRQAFRQKATDLRTCTPGPACLAIVDVDRFQAIKDTYGHIVGDAVLAAVARQLAAVTRSCDVAGRIGVDEFAILLPGDLESARAACERVLEAVRTSPVYSRDTISILASLSCGLAAWPATESFDTVFEAAYLALYEVKRTGSNSVRIAA